VNSTIPSAKTMRRPKMSDSEPAVSSTAASASEYASTIHWSWSNVVLSSVEIFGNATDTIDVSSRSMKFAMQTTTSVHHLRELDELVRNLRGLAITWATPLTCSAVGRRTGSAPGEVNSRTVFPTSI